MGENLLDPGSIDTAKWDEFMDDRNYPIYFIGAGPGHVKYLTMEGKDALQQCGLVYALAPYPETFARLLTGKTVRDPFKRMFEELVGEIQEASRSAPVGFLVPGDMTVFSPFVPLVEHFSERSRVLPGVGTMNAAAALLKRTLDLPGVSHFVTLTSPKILAREGAEKELSRLAETGGTMVLYMNDRPLHHLAEELSAGFGPDTPVAIASRLGMEGEKVYRCTLSTMAQTVGGDDIFGLASGDPSLAIIIVGAVLEARSDPDFWDKRKHSFWDRRKSRI